MAFLISDIRKSSPKDNCRYLFDSNVWLAVLHGFYNEQYYAPYNRFFNEIIHNKIAPKATIVIPSLLISELINRVMNDIYYYEYCKYNPPKAGQSKSNHYKNDFRKSDEYVADLEDTCSGIRDYHDKISFISDELHTYTCKTLIKKIPSHLDFNDYVYSKMALKEKLVIVTNDSDFKVEDIEILTTQKGLLDLMIPVQVKA